MSQVDVLRNGIIEKLLAISNKDYLRALYHLIDNKQEDDLVLLSEEQILMLKLSERDIQEGKFISQKDLDKNDLKWLKEL